MAPGSRIAIGSPQNLGTTGSVFAYGDRDDPARLVVLLADRVLAVCDHSSDAAKNVRVCLEPRTPWRTRLQCLGSALHDAADGLDEPFIALWDVDALVSTETESWDQERSSLLRRDLLRLVRDAAMTGGWILVRTSRAHTLATSTVFDDLDLEREIAPDTKQIPEEARLFAPECRPIASWLVERDILRPRDLAEVERTVKRAEEHLVDLAYESLPPVARDAVSILTALRAPQALNGHYGPLPFETDAARASARSLPATTRAVLLDSGLIQPTWSSGPWRMPRIVRARLAQLAQLTVAVELQGVHRSEAEADANADTGTQVEAHYHAICTGDIELAKRTAVYYGSELSEVATRLSLEAQDTQELSEKQRLFTAAADLFHHVVTSFDDTDAYAWEYYGYNLARAESADAAEILEAYRRAFALRPGNPLYHGRLLGFRAELGQRVVEEAIASVHQYALDAPERESVSLFVEAVMKGLWRGVQRQQAHKLLTSCHALLERLAPRTLQRAAWVRVSA
jgi:hypothetical protein